MALIGSVFRKAAKVVVWLRESLKYKGQALDGLIKLSNIKENLGINDFRRFLLLESPSALATISVLLQN